MATGPWTTLEAWRADLTRVLAAAAAAVAEAASATVVPGRCDLCGAPSGFEPGRARTCAKGWAAAAAAAMRASVPLRAF